jgi:hypothetical protein
MQKKLSVEVVQNKTNKEFLQDIFSIFSLTVEKTLFIPQYLCSDYPLDFLSESLRLCALMCVSCRLAIDAIRDVIQASTRHTGCLLDSECPLLEGRKGNQGVGVAACCVVEVASH